MFENVSFSMVRMCHVQKRQLDEEEEEEEVKKEDTWYFLDQVPSPVKNRSEEGSYER
jgi:hypothetical protein